MGAHFEQATHAHELSLGWPCHDVSGADAVAHQLAGGLDAVAVMLKIHPDSIETQQTGQLEDRGIGQVELRT